MFAKKRMVPLEGARFIWEVAHRQSFLPFFSDECNKQEVFVFPCKNASRFEAKASS